VSEPQINLRLEGEPSAYQPALGPRVSFRLSYRQRAAVTEDPNVFGVGTNWSCSFRAFIYEQDASHIYLHRGSAGLILYGTNSPQVWDGTIVKPLGGGGYEIEHSDGAVDKYTTSFTDGAGDALLFLATRADPAGNAIAYSYSTNGAGILQLNSVTDADGHSTQLYYENASFPSLITRVVDAFSRTNRLVYDNHGYLTNVVDVQGMSSSFAYDSSNQLGWITNMVTPYGATDFSFGGLDATNANENSASG
jgi:YD repeat-containing protein